MLDNSDSIVLEHLIKFHADLRVFFLWSFTRYWFGFIENIFTELTGTSLVTNILNNLNSFSQNSIPIKHEHFQ